MTQFPFLSIKPDLSLVGFHTLINFWELQKTNSAYQ